MADDLLDGEDLYLMLGVHSQARPAEIKAAYRRLVMGAHPDRGGDPTAFMRLTRAYEVLSDPTRRKFYDEHGFSDEAQVILDGLKMVDRMALFLDEAIKTIAGPIEEFDVVARMRDMARHGLEMAMGKEAELLTALQQYQKLHKRLRRRDEAKNQFADIIAQKVRKLGKEAKEFADEIRIARRAVEELERYESVVDIVRTVQAQNFFSRYSVSIDDILTNFSIKRA